MRGLENRIPPPLLMVGFAVAMVWQMDGSYQQAGVMLWAAATMVAGSGLAVMVAALVSFRRRRTTVNPLAPSRASTLVVEGVFCFSRNPMYLGMVFLLVAVALLGGLGWQWLGVAGFGFYIARWQIAPEERAMVQLFGADYQAYCRQVNRWLGWRSVAD